MSVGPRTGGFASGRCWHVACKQNRETTTRAVEAGIEGRKETMIQKTDNHTRDTVKTEKVAGAAARAGGPRGFRRLNRVLVVDDSPLVHKIYKVFLNKYRGCEIVQAKNGKEGLLSLERGPEFDLILLDINMPVMNGIEFLETVKQGDRFTHIPIIIISTEGKEADTMRGLGLGAKGYIVKPFKAATLYTIIDRIFGSQVLVGKEGAHGV